MKMKSFLSLLAALMLCAIAFAKMPFSNDMFGRVESTLDHCAEIDKSSGEKYAAKKKQLVKDATAEEIEAARNADVYKAAYKDMSGQLAQMPKDDVMQACTAVLKSEK